MPCLGRILCRHDSKKTGNLSIHVSLLSCPPLLSSLPLVVWGALGPAGGAWSVGKYHGLERLAGVLHGTQIVA